MARHSRARYGDLIRIATVATGVLALLMLYVMLTSNLTGLTYAVGNAEHQRHTLQEQTLRLDDRIATLRSDARLAAIAAHLGMAPPQRFALVRMPQPEVAVAPPRLTSLSSLAGLLMPPLARRH